MTNPVRIELDLKPLKRLPRDVRRQAGQIVAATVRDLERAIDQRVPVDSGDTRNTKRAGMYGPTLGGVSYADAALHLEYGTAKMAAQPFIRPGAKAVEAAFIARCKELFT